MIKGYIRVNLIGLLCLFLVSCSKYQKLRKSTDWQLKYEAAMKYYEKKDFARAVTLFEDILPIIRGTKEAESANFYYAYAHFYQDLFILSAHYFETFLEIYSRSDLAIEANYMFGYSLYMQSPEFNLDQSPSNQAINVMQNFISQHPTSKFAENAGKIVNELELKLEKKEFENAKLYYKLQKYEAAIVTLENFITEFPGSAFQEEALFLTIKTAHDYAAASIISLQNERFKSCIDKYQIFVDKYPNSTFLKDAEKYYVNSTDFLTKFALQNN